MKRVILITAGFIVVSACLIAARAYAATAPGTPPPGSTATLRLAQRKAERNITLDDKDSKRLLTTCKVGQDKISLLKGSTNQSFISRQKEYNNIIGDMWVVTGKLKLAGKDTFQLEKELATLTDKINNFQATRLNYQQALDDTVVVNCQADIVGFKALLETDRLYYADLQAKSKDISSYITDSIKTSLNGFLSELQGNDGSGQ